MYDYSSSYNSYETTSSIFGGMMATFGVVMLITSVLGIITLVSQWKVYKKAGKHGWECLIPIYNNIILIEIAGLPLWYIALLFIPFANIYATFKIHIDLSHKFGKSTGFGVAMVFFNFICFPILAFGKEIVYNRETNSTTNNNQQAANINNTTSIANDVIDYSNPNIQPPVTFNENVNTEINHIPQNENQSTNNINNAVEQPSQPISFGMPMPAPIVNPQTELNVISNQENITPQVENKVVQQTTQTINIEPTLNVIPNMEPTTQTIANNMTNDLNNQINVVPQPAPIAPQIEQQPQIVTPQPTMNNEQQINVIPGMAPMPQHTENNQNTTNM